MTSPTLPPNFESIEKSEAQKRFQLEKVDTIGKMHHSPIIVHNGDLHLSSDLTEKWVRKTFWGGVQERRHELLIIDGNLSIDGALSLGTIQSFPSLIVRGDVQCIVMETYSSLTQIDGNLTIERVYHGYQHSGQLRVGGQTHTPFFISYVHPDWFPIGSETISINYFSDKDEFIDFDYNLSDIVEIFDPALFVDGVDMEDEIVAYNFSQKMMTRFEKGESPFRDDFTPQKKQKK